MLITLAEWNEEEVCNLPIFHLTIIIDLCKSSLRSCRAKHFTIVVYPSNTIANMACRSCYICRRLSYNCSLYEAFN